MASILESIFGKQGGITKEEVEEEIIIAKYKESIDFDCKEVDSGKIKIDDKIKEDSIIKTLVAFLNTFSGTGLLCLGVRAPKGIPKTFISVKDTIFKNEEQLRSIIRNNINSIPFTSHLPKLTIEKIKFNEGSNIFLIEVERIDNNCIYYSKISENAYMRINDETQRLNLHETLDLISKKNFPKIFMTFKDPVKTENGFEIDIKYINEGLEPGRFISTFIKMYYADDINLELNGTTVTDETNNNADSKKAYSIIAGYPPNTTFVYPLSGYIFAKLRILTKDDFDIKMTILTQENKGVSKQIFTFCNYGGELSIKEDLGVREYRSYLNLSQEFEFIKF